MRKLILTLFALISYAATAFAVMPPGVYAERSKNAEYKAIVVVTSTETVDIKRSTKLMRATFKTEYALTSETPDTFSGMYESVREDAKDEVPDGGTIYFYPTEGERVFVTVSGPGGCITSLTPMTPELEKAIRETPERIRYGMSKARVE